MVTKSRLPNHLDEVIDAPKALWTVFPLTQWLPHFFIGVILACCLHQHRSRYLKIKDTLQEHGGIPPCDLHCLYQFLSMIVFVICCLILLKAEVIESCSSHSRILHLLSKLMTSSCIAFLLFSFLVYKSHPSFNYYFFTSLSSLSSFCSNLSSFPTYIYISHFLICFECIFVFDHNMGHTFSECMVVAGYITFLTCVCHAVLKELILKPGQRFAELILGYVDKMILQYASKPKRCKN